MTREPKTVRPISSSARRSNCSTRLQKTQLIVVEQDKPVGVVHFHDLLRAGVA